MCVCVRERLLIKWPIIYDSRVCVQLCVQKCARWWRGQPLERQWWQRGSLQQRLTHTHTPCVHKLSSETNQWETSKINWWIFIIRTFIVSARWTQSHGLQEHCLPKMHCCKLTLCFRWLSGGVLLALGPEVEVCLWFLDITCMPCVCVIFTLILCSVVNITPVHSSSFIPLSRLLPFHTSPGSWHVDSHLSFLYYILPYFLSFPAALPTPFAPGAVSYLPIYTLSHDSLTPEAPCELKHKKIKTGGDFITHCTK